MSVNYEVTMMFRDVTVRIECVRGQPAIRISGDVSANELAGLHGILEIIQCLSTGKEIGPHFNPTENHAEEDQVIKCMWDRSGNLRIVGPTDRFHQHAETVDDALKRNRVFTTTRRISKKLPLKRG